MDAAVLYQYQLTQLHACIDARPMSGNAVASLYEGLRLEMELGTSQVNLDPFLRNLGRTWRTTLILVPDCWLAVKGKPAPTAVLDKQKNIGLPVRMALGVHCRPVLSWRHSGAREQRLSRRR